MACGQLEFVGVKQDYLQMHKPQNLKQSERKEGRERGETDTSKKNNFHTISREENCPDRRQQQQHKQQQNKCEQSQKVDKGNGNNKKNNKDKHNGISNK